MNTLIKYLYRDANDNKVPNRCVVEGEITPKQIKHIMKCCDKGVHFIPHQVGLPEERFEPYDPAVDHCWFEMRANSFQKVFCPTNIALTAQELIRNFDAAKNNWTCKPMHHRAFCRCVGRSH